MKRIISMIFILCLVVALSLSVSAESKNKLTYAVGASAPTVSANTEFTVLVEITENTGFCWLQIVVDFDSSVLDYVGASTDASSFKEASIQVNEKISGTNGKCLITIGSMSDLIAENPPIRSAKGTVASLTFKVKEGTPAGTSTTLNIHTPDGVAVKIVNGVVDDDFEIKATTLDIYVADGSHLTCTPGTATKENVISATCSAEGSYDSVTKCIVCGKELSREKVKVEKTSHIPGSPVKETEVPGTCQTEGFYTSVVRCTLCNYKMSTETVKTTKADHSAAPSVKENVKDATCTKSGSYDDVVKCSVCSIELSRKKTEIPKKDHAPGSYTIENIVDSTCVKPGSYDTVTHCMYCNAVMSTVKSEIAISAHTISSSVKEKMVNATCVTPGSYDEVYYCAVCHVEISRTKKTISVVDHTPGAEATETTAQVCLVCNYVIKPAKGHTHTWETTLHSDQTGHWYPCSTCNEKKDSASHVYDNTCDAECNTCKFKRVPGDHAYGSWNTVKEPTATTEGQRERACILCGNKVTESIPATGPETTTPPETTKEPDVTTTAPEVTTEPAPGTSEEVTTESAPGTTAPEATKPEDTTDPTVSDPGCGSAVSMGIALIAILGTALIMKKRD